MVGDQRSAQKIDAALEAAHVAARARIGEGLIVVVNRLPEEAPPGCRRNNGQGPGADPFPGRQAIRCDRTLNRGNHPARKCRPSGRRACLGCWEPQLPRQRLHHPIGGELRPDDRKVDAGRQRVRRRIKGEWRDRQRHATAIASQSVQRSTRVCERVTTGWPDSRTTLRKPGSKNGAI